MRLGQLVALVAVYFEASFIFRSSEEFVVSPLVISLLSLLVASELVRVGRKISYMPLVWVGYMARFAGLGWAGTGFVLLLLVWAFPDRVGDVGLQVLFWASAGIALVVSLYAFSTGRTRIVVTSFHVGKSSNKPSLRVALLSDLHIGDYVSAAHIRKAVDLSNSQSPDFVILLGDYVDSEARLIDELLNELSALESTHGVFAVLGNHDIRADEPQHIVEQFEAEPTIRLLRNSSVEIEVGDGEHTRNLRIIGIESQDDWWSSESDVLAYEVIEREIATDPVGFTVVACHHPEVFDQCVPHSIDLAVAGHTHGGQLALPFFGRTLNVGRLVAKYLRGAYVVEKSTLIVTTGIGVGVIPARMGVSPEVTIVELAIE